ncbi:hypothetical protein BDP81DRAFT_110387 [Colletotrichum phormii]|uniref:DUF7082 domain-containing protein n=1 Tax=Colletotrichum phormii TaxID=359342 RepID=A0AAI9ZHS6_9PEZI|nr:uncharacterized protein BDP81DRAFT_110387 [Colletotrichum phormii]KAK1624532.1 hypothetical protein BDP81DRAFT_110387 [Colletotrichum phormii]
MSAAKFECASYKHFEPDFHPQRPIIIGEEGLDSPETVTLKYEEAVARANGDLRGDSPPGGLLPMSHYGKPQPGPIHGYDSSRGYQDAGYQQYGAQTYPAQHGSAGQLTAAQMNQEAFAANSAVGSYMPVSVSVNPSVVSYQPSSGMAGTKVQVKINSPYDLLTVAPFYSLVFGANKVSAQPTKESQDSNGYMFTVSADAPPFVVTGCASENVPVLVLIETENGEQVMKEAAGQFVYHEAGPGASSDGITRKLSKSPEQQHQSPRSASTQLGNEVNTNTYDFATAPQQPAQSPYGNSFSQDNNNNNMLSAYRTNSFPEQHYARAVPPPLRPPMVGWQAYGRTPGPPITHTQISRPSLTPLPMPSATMPLLVRTSSIPSSPGGGQQSGYNHWGSYSNKAQLKIVGKLDTMSIDWSPEEWSNRRRIVMFSKKQTGSTLTATFRPVNVNERPPNSICISCIWWAEKNECYVTSVDTIYLLEQLVVAPARFTVEEKNRIRRNLEGFRPLTVSKAKADSEEFFKIIMGFPNPKPRNIEKDVKVFPWKILESALKKIIGKYSASPSSTLPASHLLTPTPVNAYPPPLPTPPAPTVASDHVSAYGVPSQVHHHEGLTSPRSITGSTHSWPAYSTGPPRNHSPALASVSPRQSGLRLAAPLPAVTGYDSRSMTTHSYGGGLQTPLGNQHTPPSAPGRWDPTIPAMHAPTTYAEQYQSMAAHHNPSHQVYGGGGYGDGAQRA